MPGPSSGPCSMVTAATKMAEPRTTILSPPSSAASNLVTNPTPAMVMAVSSQNLMMLLMPHLILALVILLLLFADFVLYRRRVQFQQKRAFDKQELMETFPKRVIGGLHRNIPGSVNASPLHTASPNHLTVPHELNGTEVEDKISVKADKTSARTEKTPLAKADKTSTTTKTSSDTTTSSGSTGSGTPPEAAATKKQPRKKLVRLLEGSRSSTTLSADSVDSAATVDRDSSHADGGGPPVSGIPPVSRRRLERRESCRKLPPIKQESRFTNGFAQKEDKKLSPLIDEGEREDLSMA